MRKQLELLDNKLNRMEVGYTVDAICDLREVIREILEILERALPEDKSDDV